MSPRPRTTTLSTRFALAAFLGAYLRFMDIDLSTLCTLGVGAAVLGILGLLAQAFAAGRCWAAWLAVGVLALAMIFAAGVALRQSQALWLPPLALASVWGLFRAVRSPRLARAFAGGFARAASPCPQWGVLLIAGLILTGWCVNHADPDSADLDLPELELDGTVRAGLEPASTVALTDRGRVVPLMFLPQSVWPEGAPSALESRMAREPNLYLQMLRTAPPNWRANCHGWVFAGGDWFVTGGTVDQILEDNGYRPVAKPRANDLVVYRDALGRLTHTAVVRTIREDGLVLVEGKWAWLGCYIHPVLAQPFASVYSYHRSSRTGHRLRGLEGESVPLLDGLPTTASAIRKEEGASE